MTLVFMPRLSSLLCVVENYSQFEMTSITTLDGRTASLLTQSEWKEKCQDYEGVAFDIQEYFSDHLYIHVENHEAVPDAEKFSGAALFEV